MLLDLPVELMDMILELLPSELPTIRQVCRSLQISVNVVCEDLYKPGPLPNSWPHDIDRSWRVYKESSLSAVASTSLKRLLVSKIDSTPEELLHEAQHFIPQLKWVRHDGHMDDKWHEAMFVVSLACDSLNSAVSHFEHLSVRSLRLLVAALRFGYDSDNATMSELLSLDLPKDNDWIAHEGHPWHPSLATRRDFIHHALKSVVVRDDVKAFGNVRAHCNELSLNASEVEELAQLAARSGAVNVLRILYDELSATADEDDVVAGDNTLLYQAATAGQLQTLHFLLEAGEARHNIQHFRAAVESAAANDFAGALIVLQELRPTLFDAHRNILYASVFADHRSTLYGVVYSKAAKKSKTTMIEFVANYLDQDINRRCPRGRTALHHAATVGDPVAISGALALGADPSLRDLAGQSACEVAISHGHLNAAAQLGVMTGGLELLAHKRAHATGIALRCHGTWSGWRRTTIDEHEVDLSPNLVWQAVRDMHVQEFSLSTLVTWTSMQDSNENKSLVKFLDLAALAPREPPTATTATSKAYAIAERITRQLYLVETHLQQRERHAAACVLHMSWAELGVLDAFLATETGNYVMAGLRAIHAELLDLKDYWDMG